jgi:hypothetical protein
MTTLIIYQSLQIRISEDTIAIHIQGTGQYVPEKNSLFSLALLALLFIIAIKRKKVLRAVVGSILGFSSYVFW